MKVFLMNESTDVDLETPLPAQSDLLTQDLELEVLLGAMAGRDPFLREMSQRALLLGLVDPAAIRYRQHVLADCLHHPVVIREIYEIAVDAAERRKRSYFGILRNSPDATLAGAHRVMTELVPLLTRLRDIAREQRMSFQSSGWRRFFDMLVQELTDDYLEEVAFHLRSLDPHRGILLNAELGHVTGSVDYKVRVPRRFEWKDWNPFARGGYSFQVPPRDDAGFKALANMRSRGVNQVANALAQSADHVRSFFRMLQHELAFYVASLNLHDQLVNKGEPTCFPTPHGEESAGFQVEGIYDVCLSLKMDERVVGNDVDAGGAGLVVITGANQGGKSTFLRSVGLAQLMMQSGMFVPAEAYSGAVSRGVFTHFKREEDPSMTMGKLEEELARMNDITTSIEPFALLLCNESFASTNEREGSEIARQILRAMTEAGVRVFLVTHLYDLAHRRHRWKPTSSAPSGVPAGSGPSSSSRGLPSRRASARTCTGGSLPRLGPRLGWRSGQRER
jgi:hypothetical protein